MKLEPPQLAIEHLKNCGLSLAQLETITSEGLSRIFLESDILKLPNLWSDFRDIISDVSTSVDEILLFADDFKNTDAFEMLEQGVQVEYWSKLEFFVHYKRVFDERRDLFLYLHDLDIARATLAFFEHLLLRSNLLITHGIQEGTLVHRGLKMHKNRQTNSTNRIMYDSILCYFLLKDIIHHPEFSSLEADQRKKCLVLFREFRERTGENIEE